METISRIKELISNLPISDQKYAKEFLQKRDFDSLQEIVNSAIIITKRALKAQKDGKKIKQEYLDADLDGMRELKGEIDTYAYPLQDGLDTYSENDITDF